MHTHNEANGKYMGVKRGKNIGMIIWKVGKKLLIGSEINSNGLLQPPVKWLQTSAGEDFKQVSNLESESISATLYLSDHESDALLS